MYDSVNLPLSPLKIWKKTLTGQRRMAYFLIYVAILMPVISTFFSRASDPYLIHGSSQASFNSGAFIWVAVLAIILSLLVIESLIVIYQFYYYKLYYYKFTEESGEIRKGVISRATGIVRYERLQNIYVDQDIFDRMFGLYDVHYETAGETSNFYSHVDGLNQENANKLIQFLNEKVKGGSMNNTEVASQVNVTPANASLPNNSNQMQDSGSMELSRQTCPLSRNLIAATAISLAMVIYIVLGGITFILSLRLWQTELDFIPPIFSLVVLVLSVVGGYLYSSTWFRNFNFIFYSKRGEVFTQVIGRSTTYLYYDRIQNINIAQNFYEKLFSINRVTVETAGGGFPVVIPGLELTNAQRIRDFLLEKAKNYKNNL